MYHWRISYFLQYSTCILHRSSIRLTQQLALYICHKDVEKFPLSAECMFEGRWWEGEVINESDEIHSRPLVPIKCIQLHDLTHYVPTISQWTSFIQSMRIVNCAIDMVLNEECFLLLTVLDMVIEF